MRQDMLTQNVDESNLREKVIQNLKKIDNKQHQQIYHEVLKKHNLKYSKNQNGIFLNLEDVSTDIVRELHNYINLLSETEMTVKRDAMLNTATTTTTTKDVSNGYLDSTPKPVPQLDNKCSQYNECEKVILENMQSVHVDVRNTLTALEKERALSHRKISQNKFLAAKKKFSKPTVMDTRNTCNELMLDM